MDFKSAFVISDENDDSNSGANCPNSTHGLNNYNHYEPKLPKDFYLNYFIHDLLFVVDIMELQDFLTYHLDNVENPLVFCKLLDLKVIPTMKSVVENAEVNWNGRNSDEIELEDGFYELNNIVTRFGYAYRDMCHKAGLYQPRQELVKKIEEAELFLKNNYSAQSNFNRLRWDGENSHLSYIISELVNQGFIEPPRQNSGEINYSELCRQIKTSFNLTKDFNIGAQRKFASPDNEKYQGLDYKFKNENFHIPYIKSLS
ncbi:hypothetical protein ACU8DI_01550 [Psychroserpens sp. BH13MA-6]